MTVSGVSDLGVLDGPLMVFGGPYSNLQATQALKEIAEQRSIPPNHVICTGDVVAYCADPERTVTMVREWGIHVVMGNCEESLGEGAEDCGCGFNEGSVCDLLSSQWYRFARDQLSTESRAWMRGLPRQLILTWEGRRIRVVHGGVGSINQFIFPSVADETLDQELNDSATDLVVAGHSGIPFGRRLTPGSWLNAGVIGLPANDGSADGWYMVLESSVDGPAASWHRLHYCAAEAAARMRQQALPDGYAQALERGLWPSEDVLPAAERSQAGHALRLAPLLL